MKVSRFILSSILLSSLLGGGSFVYADNTTDATPQCAVCVGTPAYVDEYISFATDIIQAYQTYANTSSSIISNKSTTDQASQDEFQKVLQGIVNGLNDKAQSVVTVGTLAGIVGLQGAFSDSWKQIWLFTQPQAVMRDWTKVDNIDHTLTNTINDLGNAGAFVRIGFKVGIGDRIAAIIKAHSAGEKALFRFQGDSVSDQPIDVLSALRSMNQSRKTFISTYSTEGLSQDFLNGRLTFNENIINQMTQDYSCVRGLKGRNACSTIGSQLKDSVNSVKNSTKKKSDDAIKIIKDSIKRLSSFWSSNGGAKDDTKQRQQQLVKGQYGLSLLDNQGLTGVQGFVNAYKSIVRDATEAGSFLGSKGESNGGKKNVDVPYVGDLATRSQQRNDITTFTTIFDTTIAQADNARQQSSLADTSPITKLFPALTQELVNARYLIAGSSSTTIWKNLGKACDLQCSNVGGTCRYDQ